MPVISVLDLIVYWLGRVTMVVLLVLVSVWLVVVVFDKVFTKVVRILKVYDLVIGYIQYHKLFHKWYEHTYQQHDQESQEFWSKYWADHDAKQARKAAESV